MLDIFGEGDLPNPPPGPLYDTDVATFREISLYADSIDLSCVVLRHGGGYRIAGGLFRPTFWVLSEDGMCLLVCTRRLGQYRGAYHVH